MIKKIFILFLFIVFCFGLGLYINYFYDGKTPIIDNSIFLVGTIDDITNNVATLIPQNMTNSSELNYTFNLPVDEESLWVVGDIVKISYFPENIKDGTNIVKINAIESIGKARLFDPKKAVPVSNADHRGNGIVFKSFFAYDNLIILDSFSTKDEFYYKKITTFAEYEEYKKLVPDIRTLTENDFINYYLVIVMTKDINSTYMFNDIEEKETEISLEILKGQNLSNHSKSPVYSGVSIILPNVLDVPQDNINFTIAK